MGPDSIRTPVALIMGVVVLIVGYAIGAHYGRDDMRRAWHGALSQVESDGCRNAVRDVLQAVVLTEAEVPTMTPAGRRC